MAEHVFLPSDEYLVEQLIEDLAKIAEIPETQVGALVETLNRLEGIPSAEQLGELVAKGISDTDAGAAVISLLGNVSPESLDEVLDAVDESRQGNDEIKAIFTDQILSDLKATLPRLIREYPAINRYQKASFLAGLTGSTAENVEIVCDIRPLFTEDRSEILGLIPNTILRLGYSSQDGTDHVIEVNLSEELLQVIADKVNLAQRKLEVIHSAGSKWVPHGVATRS